MYLPSRVMICGTPGWGICTFGGGRIPAVRPRAGWLRFPAGCPSLQTPHQCWNVLVYRFPDEVEVHVVVAVEQAISPPRNSMARLAARRMSSRVASSRHRDGLCGIEDGLPTNPVLAPLDGPAADQIHLPAQ